MEARDSKQTLPMSRSRRAFRSLLSPFRRIYRRWTHPRRRPRRSRRARSERQKPISFWSRRSVRGLLQGITTEGIVVCCGVIGYLLLGWTFSDAFYMVVITISGVGFGEVRPLNTPIERLHTILVITFGMVAVGYTLARFIQFLTEAEILNLVGHRRMRKQIEQLSGHTIVGGFGRVGALVCEELTAAELPFVVIELSPEKIPDVEARGYLHVHGDATEESVLLEAGLLRAGQLVTVMPQDATNVYITLTARQMCPKVKIIARADLPSTQKKLRQAGADHVILPAAIGARRIVSLLTNPSAVEFVELVTQRSSLAIEMDDIPILDASPLRDQSLRDADIGRRTGVIVIAVKRADGRVQFPPSGDERLASGDSIVVLGRRSNLDQFRKLFAP